MYQAGVETIRNVAMKRYTQLSGDEREELAILKAAELSNREIAKRLGRSPSTISREITRNANLNGSYKPTSAHGRYLGRRQRPCLLDQDAALCDYITQRLHAGWSPEAIAGWLGQGNERLRYVNHESIYRWIYARANKAQELWRYLFQRKHTRKPKAARPSKDRIAQRVSIHDRPENINEREHLGHWETDYVIFKNRQPLLVIHERKSKVTLAVKLMGRTAGETISALTAQFKKMAKSLRASVTFDNDTGFALHHHLRTTLGMETYFCDAYASWQKGGVENANGRLRYWLPKRTDLSQISDKEIEDILLDYNLMPRRCLGWKTPLQAFVNSDKRTLEIKFA